MLKEFNKNLNSLVGTMWGISLSMLLGSLFNSAIKGESFIPKTEFTIILLSFATIFNLIISTYILIKGGIKQVNITYVCPTARKYMSEQEISEYEKVVEIEIRKDKEFIEELEKAYKEM